MQAQLAGAREQIANELRRIVASVQTDLKRAVQQEQDLSARLAQLKVRSGGVNVDLVTLRELEREAAAKRAVYEGYLLRAKETGEQRDINTANISVISQAYPPLDPTGPSRAMIALGGMMLGFIAGLGLGVLRGIGSSLRDSRPFPSPLPGNRRRVAHSFVGRSIGYCSSGIPRSGTIASGPRNRDAGGHHEPVGTAYGTHAQTRSGREGRRSAHEFRAGRGRPVKPEPIHERPGRRAAGQRGTSRHVSLSAAAPGLSASAVSLRAAIVSAAAAGAAIPAGPAAAAVPAGTAGAAVPAASAAVPARSRSRPIRRNCAAAAIPAAFCTAARAYPYPPQPPQPAFHAWQPQPMPYDPYGRPQQVASPYPAYPMTAPQAPAPAYPQAAQPAYAAAAEPYPASSPREMSPIEEVRESLREFRDAIRDLTESRARRSY